LNIVFLVEDSGINNSHTIEFISDRIKSSLQISIVEVLNNEDKYGIFKFIKTDGCIIYLECYRIKQENKYLINAIGINEEEKNNLIELISSDQLFKNQIILIDTLSNQFISQQYGDFALLENNIKHYFALKLLNRYGSKAYKVIDDIKTKDDLIVLPSNIKTNLQKIELVTLIEQMLDKPLGGLEYETYFEKYDKSNLEELKEVLKEDIFSEIKRDLKDNKNIIKEYRNIICHNRFLNCKRMEESHCVRVQSLVNKIISFNNIMLNNLYGTTDYKYYDVDIYAQRFTFALKRMTDLKYNELILINILCKLNLIYNKDYLMINIENENLLIYKSDRDGIFINIKGLEKDTENNEQTFIITIEFDRNTREKENINDIILKQLNEGEIIILYDSLSIEKSINLSKSFTVLENLFREYITLFQYIENISENNKDDNIPCNLRIGINGKSVNSIYDLNFIELLPIISAPNGGNNIEDLIKKLKKSIYDNDIENIEFLLNNMLDYNNDLKIIVKYWCELYRFRTLIAHCGTLIEDDYRHIQLIVNSTRLTVENIFVDYLYNNTNVFKYHDNITIHNSLKIHKNNINNKGCDLSFIKEINSIRSVSKIENLYIFRVVQIINKLMSNNNENLEQVFSYEYLSEFILSNRDKLIELIESDNFKDKLILSLTETGFYEYADFRMITSQEQILEEKIGDLLNSIHNKMPSNSRN